MIVYAASLDGTGWKQLAYFRQSLAWISTEAVDTNVHRSAGGVKAAPDKHRERKEPPWVLVATCAYVHRVTVIH